MAKKTPEEELVALGTTDCAECTGACCKRVDLVTREIHKCQHLAEDNSCNIYEDRPIACRLDERWTPPQMLKAHCTACQLSEWKQIPIGEAVELLDR